MKILHVSPVRSTCNAAGLSHSFRGLAKAQSEIGLKVGLLSSYPVAQGVEIEGLSGICVVDGIHTKHFNPWFVSRDWVERIQQEFGVPDIVNFHSTYIPFHIALARWCRKLNWPYILTPRGGMTCLAQNIKGAKKKVSNFLYYRSYVKHAAAIHALCQREAQEIGDLFETKKIIIAPNGVEDYLLEAPSRLQPAELDDFNCKGDLVLGFVGRIDMYIKGIDLLLKAIAILNSEQGGEVYKLFMIGPFSTKKDKSHFFSLIESLGLKRNVKLLGPKYDEEKMRYFLACDVFVHTSRSEGMPMSALEAMALGKPCLVTPGTNISDMVVKGGGWKCKPNPLSIAEAIAGIQKQTRESIKIAGQEAHELVKKDYKWVTIAQKLIEEHSKIIDEVNS